MANASRLDDLKAILESRRMELVHELHGRICGARREGISDRDVLDAAESSEIDIQDAIEFALIQLKTETVKNIDTALRRMGEGDYGECFECGGQIAEARLRALPFAVRCRDCEEVREATDQSQRRSSQAFLLDQRR
jgi:DnaK suppressor protein